MVKNLLAGEGDVSLLLEPGKIPHASEQLRPCAITPEPVL